jgi:creatinine amidohydrolase
MRTRIFNKMTAKEVEDYLARGGNTIFVGVGVIEVHGAMPIDAETIVPDTFQGLL